MTPSDLAARPFDVIGFGELQGWPFEGVLAFANTVAAMKCRQLGGRGIPRLPEVAKFLKAHGHSDIAEALIRPVFPARFSAGHRSVLGIALALPVRRVGDYNPPEGEDRTVSGPRSPGNSTTQCSADGRVYRCG